MPRPRRRSDARATAAFLGALAVLAVLGILALQVGAYPVTPSELWAVLSGRAHGINATVIYAIRGPRILGAMLVGAALSSAGAAYQSLFRNPLVSPDILGVSSGAALGAVLGILLGLPVGAIEVASFAGGIAAMALVYGVAVAIRGHDPVLVLVLSGVVIGSLMGSGVALVKFLADPENQLPAITFWLLGSLASFNRSDLMALAPPVAIGLVPLVLLRWRLDVMTLGDEEARALGVEVALLRLGIVASATLMTAAAVSVSGVVGWIGLVVPHLARLIVGPAFRRLLPLTAVLGAAFLLAVDTLARNAGGVEVPLGVLTAVLGTPVFLWLMAAARRVGS
ncbi:MAG TPA: iron ABC transporter permease [Stellaceae bacterium]|nr:iron ABC transporter permease [Stellaceae bacterium]